MAKIACRKGNPKSEAGFSLIELMVVISLFGILAMMAMGSWGESRLRTQVETVAGEIRSAFSSARMRARATAENQTVVLNYTNETMTDALGETRTYSDTINLVAYSISTCAASTSTTSKTFTFTPRGTSTGASVMVQSLDGSVTRYIVVNSTTGRARVEESCS